MLITGAALPARHVWCGRAERYSRDIAEIQPRYSRDRDTWGAAGRSAFADETKLKCGDTNLKCGDTNLKCSDTSAVMLV